MYINDIVSQLSSQHPYLFMCASMAVGAFYPKLLNWCLTEGIDKGIAKVLSLQEFYLRKFGVSDEQIKAIQLKEAEGLKRAAEDIEKDEVKPAA